MDRFTKQQHILACNSTIDAEQFANLFIKKVFRLHGLLKTVTSDRGPQFITAFWKCLWKRLDMEARLSSLYHPQTEGGTERFNAVIELYPMCYVNHLQNDWAKWLPLAEFAANNQQSESTKLTPVFANTRRDPRITSDLTSPTRGDRENARAHCMTARMAKIYEFTRTSMIDAEQRYQDQADRNWEPALRFLPGDLAWFLTNNT